MAASSLRSGRADGLGLALIFVAALALAWFASVTPRARPAEAPQDRFAAGRAMSDIHDLATRPHPTGSLQNAHVRDALVARLSALGLSPEVQRRTGLRPWGAPVGARTWTVENVVARLPGRDPSAPALLVLSHYDSVAGSPGAADDMASVAVALELARLLKRQRPGRDVVFAFTDGEEQGLIGASALLADPTFVARIGFVLNMDVRGGGGRALMFQTGPEERGAERLFAAHPDHPASNSLAAYLYGKMPNDTDFTVALARGLPGLNYAFVGRPELYHTPAAVPAAVEPGAIQSLGDQAWAVLRPLAYGGALPGPGADLTWFDLFGRIVVAYPAWLGWAPLALGLGLLLVAGRVQRRRMGLTAGDVAAGAGQTLLAAVIAGAVLYIYGRLVLHGYYRALALAGWTEAATAGACLLGAVVAFRIPSAPARPLGRWLGAVGLAWTLGLTLQLLAPRTAFLAQWPMLLAALALAETSARAVARSAIAGVYAALALGFLLELWWVLVLGVGVIAPPVGAALLPLALAALAPFLLDVRRMPLR